MDYWYQSHAMRNSKLLLKHVVCPAFKMFALFLLRSTHKIQHGMSLHWKRRQEHALIQQFSGFCNVHFYDLVAAFKAARIMCPVAVEWMRHTAATVSALCIFPFLNSYRITDALIVELPDYVASAQDVVVTIEEKNMKLCCQHVERLPRWSAAVKQVLLVQPSSAAAE